ncbi:glycosyltransferase 87 family protein [Tsukamurella sp. 8F]|uniref:glycosyltransferase 87 family protein n=1 Tax=unclassified Tsukamurella TaxID=2633480 RepID=UPI0023BA3C2D|nr:MULTISPECIES: glycosyltransferase 87 family protein [unclassified Tsukamurella]MDF0530490.1 glycosyltransferase 87 family protein [Tsukamurella sp. 8J]MDF0587689.1 glycosyltransferase 87 family protein [Tsukamurella sp. 8F]
MAGGPSRSFPRHWGVLALFTAAAAVAVWQQIVRIPWSAPMWGLMHNQVDAQVYRLGGYIVTHHTQGLYAGPLMNDSLPFTYTPFSAVMFVPLSWMSPGVMRWVWSSLVLLALLACILIAFRLMGFRRDWRVWWVSVCLVLVVTCLEPVRTTLWYGQINVFLMLLLLWDLSRPDGARWKGFSVGVTAGIKLTPLFFIAYLMVTRQWRAVRNALAALAGTVAVGFVVIGRDSWTYWTGTFLDANRVGQPNEVSNQSINGLTAYLGGSAHTSTTLWLALAVPAAALGLGVAAWAHARGQVLLSICLAGLTMTAVSPFSWGHHWVWFVPLLVMLLTPALTTRNPARRVLFIVPPLVLVAASYIWVTYYPGISPRDVDWVHEVYGIGIFLRYEPPGVLRVLYSGVYVWIFVATTVFSGLWLALSDSGRARGTRVRG